MALRPHAERGARDSCVEVLDGSGRRGVEAARFLVGLVVAQVGADDEEGSLAVPEGAFEHLGHRRGIGPADEEGDDGERGEHHLEKRELDLEGVIAVVCVVVDLDLRQAGAIARPRPVDRDGSERGLKAPAEAAARPSIPGVWQVPSRTTRSIEAAWEISQA